YRRLSTERNSNVRFDEPLPRHTPISGSARVLPAAALQRASMRDSGHAHAHEPLADLRFPGLELDPGLGTLLLESGRRRVLPAPPSCLVAPAGAGRLMAAVLP